MSVAKQPLWMNFEDIISDAAERTKDLAMHNVNPATWRMWASQASREFSRRSEAIRGTYLCPLINSQREYQLPADCLKIIQASCKPPGYSGEYILSYLPEETFLDGTNDANTGTPYNWYLTHDRTKVGLDQTPSSVGFRGITTSTGTTTTAVCSDLSSTDDFYNTYTIRFLSGASQGVERTISDYTGSTGTVTWTTVTGTLIASAVNFEIYPDTLRIEYIRAGNSYNITPQTALVAISPGNNNRTKTIDLDGFSDAVDHAENYFEGAEIRITSGDMAGDKVRVLTSTRDQESAGEVRFTVWPPFDIAPANNVTATITDVPNTPPAWHDALVEYCVFKAKQRSNDPTAIQHMQAFLEIANMAKMQDQNNQVSEFHQVREFSRGEEEWW